MQDLIFHSKPKVYGLTYLSLIPLFGLIFFFIPETTGNEFSLIESLYFSAVTITTLGYGDISPTNDLGRVIAATESDRKSTRLNSSHVAISYAVFCLKKKKNRNGS